MERPEAKGTLTRRDFLAGAAAAAFLSAASPMWGSKGAAEGPAPKESNAARGTPGLRGRGFNLHNLHGAKGLGRFQEHDFRWISDWGFDFVRVPVAYQLITLDEDPYKLDEWWLDLLDEAMEYGPRYGLHVCLDMHRAPGHKSRQRPYSLWKDQDTLEAFCFLWITLAQRYRGIPASKLSFNLINEPPPVGDLMSASDYVRVIGAAVAAIRKVTPDRPMIADGTKWANFPCPELKELGVGQSVHIYMPWPLTHYQASWMEGWEGWSKPQWPGLVWDGVTWNRGKLEEYYRPWLELAKEGVWVHCGEVGVYSNTPHEVALAWLRDVLEMLAADDIGFALWNFRGPFGILDSGRADVDYEEFHGHKLDRKLLSLLQEFA